MGGGGEMRCASKILVGKPQGKRPLEDLGVDRGKILKSVSKKHDLRVWT
jgi:hypothetical protein